MKLVLKTFDAKVISPKLYKVFLVLLIASIQAFAVPAAAQRSHYTGTQEGSWFRSLSTDRARYDPLATAKFTAVFRQNAAGTELEIVYEQLDSVVGTDTVQVQNADSVSWLWRVPGRDYTGYLAEVYLLNAGTLLDYSDIALDVSSSWSRFPRYGFLSSYPYMSERSIDSTISELNRYHINGLQFYDWQYKHNEPLAGTVQDPSPTWHDIANRTNYLSTVEGYINAAHSRGMTAMNYNLLYGAYANAYQDGVNDSWSLYEDPNHQTRDFYQLPSGWASNLYIMDPGNNDWRDYIFAQERKVFLALHFDGWHVDQLGYLGSVWNYAGEAVDPSSDFQSFLTQAKLQLNVDLVMNAVGQYGQSEIARAPVDFLYTEVWDPDSTYGDLVDIINQNSSYSENRLHTVLAAYMDYNKSGGDFNTPGVLLTDAVIFAAGGDHLELGEHMLSSEYFPTDKLEMTDSLRQDLVHYYDFMVAYENLLRDGERGASIPLSGETSSGSLNLSSRPTRGSVWSDVTMKNGLMILNMINFTRANSMAWRDKYGTQTTPDTLTGINMSFTSGTKIRKIWEASPDFYEGSPVDLAFTQTGTQVSFTIPKLLYWNTVVVELDTSVTAAKGESNGLPTNFLLMQNYPNPFNPATVISYQLAKPGHVTLRVYDALGRVVATLVDRRQGPGKYDVTFNGGRFPSGVYLYRLDAGNHSAMKKMMLVK